MIDTRERAFKRIEQLEPVFARVFREAILALSSRADVAQLTRAVELGDVDQVWGLLRGRPGDWREVRAQLGRAHAAGGDYAVETMLGPRVLDPTTGTRLRMTFDTGSPRAERWLRDHSSRFVTSISEGQRQSIRETLERGMAAGRNPRSVALDIAGRIGPDGRRTGGTIVLHRGQSTAAANAFDSLTSPSTVGRYLNLELRDRRFDSLVRRAMEKGEALSPQKATQLVDRYKDRMLLHRAETIARSEMIESFGAGRHEGILQVVEESNLDPGQVTTEWSATLDSRTRDLHREMDGQKVGPGEPFISPTGARMRWPGDRGLGAGGEDTVRCRCWSEVRIDFLAGAA